MFYTLVILSSLLLIYFYQKTDKLIFYLGALAILVIVGGFRDFGIGIDTNVYIKPYYYLAQKNDISSIINNSSGLHDDKGFLFIAYLSTFLADDSPSILLFFTNFVTWVVWFYAVYLVRKDISIVWIFAYLLSLRYLESFNIIRQNCSLAFLFLSWALLYKKKFFYSILIFVISYFVHSSSLIGITMYPSYYFICMYKEGRYAKTYIIVFIMGFILSLMMYYFFLNYFYALGLIKDNMFDAYNETSRYKGAERLNTAALGIAALQLVVAFDIIKRDRTDAMMIILYTILWTLGMSMQLIVVHLNRVALPFFVVMIFYMAKVNYNIKGVSNILKILIILLLSWSFYTTIHNNSGRIYPYTSKELGITKGY